MRTYSRNCQSCRAGRSPIVVIVVLFVVAFGIGAIVSGIARIRDAAASMTCSNNLKRISLAIHNYHDSFSRLPPLTDQGEGAPTGNGLPSMFAHLLPYIEASPGFFHEGWEVNRYHAHSSVTFDPHDMEDRTWALYGGYVNRGWGVFICPTDTTGGGLHKVPTKFVDGSTGYHSYGRCDVQMTLPDSSLGYYAVGNHAANGLLPWNHKIPDSIPKGTENVIMLAERPQVCRTATGDTIYNLWGVGFYSPQMPTFATLTPTDPPGLLTTGQIAPVVPLPDETAPDRDALIRVKIGRADAMPGLPDFANPIQLIRTNQPCDPRLPGTPHASGMRVAMADASVRGFTTNTTPWVFWSACIPTKP